MDLPLFATNVDKSQVPPIHQKRILAFINHFVINTVTFLNKFSTNCEMKFIEFESKLQKVESSLLILEGKLHSIPGHENVIAAAAVDQPTKEVTTEKKEQVPPVAMKEESEVKIVNSNVEEINTVEPPDEPSGVKASQDVRYRKYFKMLQFGVPPTAVKIKMKQEDVDPDVLDFPDRILPDGVAS